MKTTKCYVCQKEFEKEIMIEMGSLLDDSVTYTCEECFSEVGEHETVGEGRSQLKPKKFVIVVNGKGTVEVESTTEKAAFQFAQTLDEFNQLVLNEIENGQEVHITVALSSK